MTVNQDYIDALLANPRESLDVEIKDWIDPHSAHGQAKIVRACLALRNQNGGLLQVGFENGTWLANTVGAPADVRSKWDPDEIQFLVSKFAAELFEVHLRFGKLDGQEFPVLEIEPGVKFPVASKRTLDDPADASKKLVKTHAVYVRSLSASGTVSTSEAKHSDWESLSRRCFDNLEADIGRFARRHLGSIDSETAGTLAEALAGILGTQASLSPSEPSMAERTTMLLHDGPDRFQQEKIKRELEIIPQYGSLEAAAILDGEVPGGPPTTEFLNLLNAANPRYTARPLWFDSHGFTNYGDDSAPYTFEGGWEAFLYYYESDSPYNHLDFWRAEPAGRFYHYRGFEDDIGEGGRYPQAITTLDFRIVIWRITEAIAIPMAFAHVMGLVPEETTLIYAFRWSGLRDRELSSWTDPSRSLSFPYTRRQNEVQSQPISVPLDTPTSALGPFVREVTADLFATFGGFEPGKGVTETIADELLARGR